ncbi:MAG: Sec-independent protein translocase protein TatB [Dehalococcoidia bacterium]
MGLFDVGPFELIVIFVVALLVFGPDRLPEFMGQIGRWVRTLRRLSDEVTRDFTRELNLDDARSSPPPYQPPITPPPSYYPPVSGPAGPAESETDQPTPSDGAEPTVPAATGGDEVPTSLENAESPLMPVSNGLAAPRTNVEPPPSPIDDESPALVTDTEPPGMPIADLDVPVAFEPEPSWNGAPPSGDFAEPPAKPGAMP